MPSEIDFCKDFGRFWEGKWRQVGTKKRSKTEAAAEAEKPPEHWRASVEVAVGVTSWELHTMTNRSKKEVNMGRHLGSDFS